MFGAILRATNSSFRKGMTFGRSIYVTKVMNRVPTVREKSVKNEKSSRSGKSQGILIDFRKILHFIKSQGKVREFYNNYLLYF